MSAPRLLAAAALVAALVAPAGASAAKRPVTGSRTAVAAIAPAPLVTALSVGKRYWGTLPCQGRIAVLAQRPVVAGMAADSDAWVTFGSPLGANDLAAPASSYTTCAVSFARWRWPTSAVMQEDWDLVCMTMLHELGHLLGRAHDDTPGSIMAPVFTDRSSVPQACRASRPARPAARAAAPPR